MNKLKTLWQILRQLSGDSAYEQYLVHFQQVHSNDNTPPLTKKAFFRQWQDKKWNGINRCC